MPMPRCAAERRARSSPRSSPERRCPRRMSPLTLPWIDARLFLVEGVEPPNPAPGSPRGWIDFGFPMRGRERVLVRLPVRVPARGAYAIGPLRLRAGDWLGFTQTERTVSLAP